MSDGSWVTVNFIIVASREGLVTEEVDRLVVDTSNLLFRLHVLQAVSLVPAGREDIKRDLTADGVAVWKSHGQNERLLTGL